MLAKVLQDRHCHRVRWSRKGSRRHEHELPNANWKVSFELFYEFCGTGTRKMSFDHYPI